VQKRVQKHWCFSGPPKVQKKGANIGLFLKEGAERGKSKLNIEE